MQIRFCVTLDQLATYLEQQDIGEYHEQALIVSREFGDRQGEENVSSASISLDPFLAVLAVLKIASQSDVNPGPKRASAPVG